MIIACPGCEKRYKVDPKRIPPRGGFVRCPACTERIPVRNTPAPDAEPAPAAGREETSRADSAQQSQAPAQAQPAHTEEETAHAAEETARDEEPAAD
ncbi:MAG: zinc-ribbon domain-containing protein, partial [Myxococcota bacterium]